NGAGRGNSLRGGAFSQIAGGASRRTARRGARPNGSARRIQGCSGWRIFPTGRVDPAPGEAPDKIGGATRSTIASVSLNSSVFGSCDGSRSFRTSSGRRQSVADFGPFEPLSCDRLGQRAGHGGSSPPSKNGLQRRIRRNPLQLPRTAPYFFTAPMK